MTTTRRIKKVRLVANTVFPQDNTGGYGDQRTDFTASDICKLTIDSEFGSYEQLMADPEVDIVYVASPQSVHHSHARLALESGKGVLVEKPGLVFTIPYASISYVEWLVEQPKPVKVKSEAA